ncbi:isochorismatase family protein [Solirhodobacter olei]|uniref:isochorismatase family protein n=1 Tax=Solirhodobacter olei TaxID=2493082 RepID=UPI000FD77E1B|nr:isochorismatase family protein [Solirhodobacter olei]
MHQPLALPLQKTALVVVDLQEEHRADQRFLVADFGSVLARAAQLIDAARASGVPVLHAAYVRDFTLVPPRKLEPLGASGTPLFSPLGHALTEICPEVAPAPGEFVLRKNDASCFSAAAFLAEVTRIGATHLVVCGVWTEACIAATVRDAVAEGLRVVLVKDACGSGTATMHQTALLHLVNRMYGGAVTVTEAAVGLLAGATRPVWQLQGSAPLRFEIDTIARDYDAL